MLDAYCLVGNESALKFSQRALSDPQAEMVGHTYVYLVYQALTYKMRIPFYENHLLLHLNDNIGFRL